MRSPSRGHVASSGCSSARSIISATSASATTSLIHARSQLVLVSRVAGIAAPVDGVTPSIDDADALRRDTGRARALGFGAKLCIHPRQVPAVNEAFRPSESEIAWARRVVDADAVSGGAAVAVDGRMVDRPVLLKARAILAEQ